MNRVSIGSDKDLSPIRRQAVIWTNAGLLSIWTIKNKLQWNFDQNTKLFIHENASENIVCEKGAILSRGRWVNNWPSALWGLNKMAVMLQMTFCTHDDVIKWKHFPRYWPFVRGIHRSPVNSPTKASDTELWCFLSFVPWINAWVNSCEAGDLRHHFPYYDVIVMKFSSRYWSHKRNPPVPSLFKQNYSCFFLWVIWIKLTLL